MRPPLFNTANLHPEPPPLPPPIRRMKVTAIETDSNVELLTCRSVSGQNATIAGTKDYIVRRLMPHVVDDIIYVVRPEGGTDQQYDGKPVVWLEVFTTRGVFPVRVAQTGGSNGNKTTAATYTYTVKALDNTTTLGTGVAQTRPRPYGKVTAGSTYGLAFYDGTTLKLWDAGEIPTTGGC